MSSRLQIAGVLQALEHHLVDVGGNSGGLERNVALDFRLQRRARLDKRQAGQNYGGNQPDAQKRDE